MITKNCASMLRKNASWVEGLTGALPTSLLTYYIAKKLGANDLLAGGIGLGVGTGAGIGAHKLSEYLKSGTKKLPEMKIEKAPETEDTYVIAKVVDIQNKKPSVFDMFPKAQKSEIGKLFEKAKQAAVPDRSIFEVISQAQKEAAPKRTIFDVIAEAQKSADTSRSVLDVLKNIK